MLINNTKAFLILIAVIARTHFFGLHYLRFVPNMDLMALWARDSYDEVMSKPRHDAFKHNGLLLPLDGPGRIRGFW